MSKNKLFTFTYRAEVKRLATVEAKDEDEAQAKFEKGDYEEEYDIDIVDRDDFHIVEEEEIDGEEDL